MNDTMHNAVRTSRVHVVVKRLRASAICVSLEDVRDETNTCCGHPQNMSNLRRTRPSKRAHARAGHRSRCLTPRPRPTPTQDSRQTTLTSTASAAASASFAHVRAADIPVRIFLQRPWDDSFVGVCKTFSM